MSDKLGKIKIILFIFNNEYLKIGYNELLFSNEAFKFFKNATQNLQDGKENIIMCELRERLFDSLVYFNFKNKFTHNYDETPISLSIDLKRIEKQLDEILTFIK